MSTRFKGDVDSDCLLSVDAIDFMTPKTLERSIWNHKCWAPGLRYEVALCIETGDICWIKSPYKCGKLNDIIIFRHSFMLELEEGERIEADDGYVGETPRYIKYPKSFTKDNNCELAQSLVRNRQEPVNSRLKYWEILEHMYQHNISKHGDVFRSITVITPLALSHGKRLF